MSQLGHYAKKKLPGLPDRWTTTARKRTSATAAFEPERPHLANTAAAARCKKCSTESTTPPALFRPPSATKDTMGQRVSLQEELINMKITSKQMVSASKKCEKNEKKYRKDVKKAIEKGNAEGARIYAQNAIREKNSGLNYLRMSARIDAVAQRLDTVVKNQAMQKSIVKVNKGLSSALKSMNVEKISKEMDAFEKQFEDIDVRAKYMEDAMGNTTASATPEDQVDALISQVADEHQLDVSFALDVLGLVNTAPAQQQADPLADRLEARR